MNIKPEMLVIYGALIGFAGSIVGALSAVLVTLLTKRSDERKHYRELIVKAAIEHWKHASELALKQGGYIFPLEVFMIQMTKFSEMVLDKRIASEKISERYAEYDAVVKSLLEYKMENPVKPQRRI
jgi:hypothetical protein